MNMCMCVHICIYVYISSYTHSNLSYHNTRIDIHRYIDIYELYMYLSFQIRRFHLRRRTSYSPTAPSTRLTDNSSRNSQKNYPVQQKKVYQYLYVLFKCVNICTAFTSNGLFLIGLSERPPNYI
jgi:hypothetical protein